MHKEPFEWINSWCDNTDKNDKPRALLIGDSIVCGYQNIVREKLREYCYVDYIALSYSIDCHMYQNIINAFVKDSRYELIHFNFGLHGHHVKKEDYRAFVKALLEQFYESKVILATTTAVYEAHGQIPSEMWTDKVNERNEAVRSIVSEGKCSLNDLYRVSAEIPFGFRSVDGIHYNEHGYELLAKAVADSIIHFFPPKTAVPDCLTAR